ncbi:MAG: hypothetical protein RLZZ511_555 [Cyanobacteriota bacterium]|jgi:hypothetical protein
MSIQYQTLILVEQTETQLILQKGQPHDRPSRAGLKFDFLILIAIAVFAGIWTMHHQRAFSSAPIIVYWAPVILTLISLILGTISNLNAITYEIWTFDRSRQVLQQEGYSRLGKRIKSHILEQFTAIELTEQQDEGFVYYAINLLRPKRRRLFLGWSRGHTDLHAAITLHHYRQLTQQVRDFLWPDQQGQPIQDKTTGKSLNQPLSVIDEERAAAGEQLKSFFWLLLGNRAKKQTHIANLHQQLLQSPDNAELHWQMALALSMSRTTQSDAANYFQRAKQLYLRDGDLHQARIASIDKSLRQLERGRRSPP